MKKGDKVKVISGKFKDMETVLMHYVRNMARLENGHYSILVNRKDIQRI
jgi:transcription antitermination factor NusG